jgi:hypothetical protein
VDLHGAQFGHAGVDEAEADGGDAIVPKHAGSAAVGQSDAEGAGRREELAGGFGSRFSCFGRMYVHGHAFPGAEQG